MTQDRFEKERWAKHFAEIPAEQLYTRPEFIDNITDNQIDGFWDSTAAGFSLESGTLPSVGMAIHDRFKFGSDADVKDPNFNPYKHMQDQGLWQQGVWKRLEESDQPADIIAYEMITNATSPHQVERAILQWGRKRELEESSEEHGFGTFLGSVVGFIPDVATAFVLGGPVASGVAGVARLSKWIELSQRINKIAQVSRGSIATARLPGAIKAGLTGGAWGLGETAMYDINRIVTNDEYLFNTLGGILFGAALGGIFPRVIGRVHVNETGELRYGPTLVNEALLHKAMAESEYAGTAGAKAVDEDAASAAAEQNVRMTVAKSQYSPWHNLQQKWAGIVGTAKMFTSPKNFIGQLGNGAILFGKKHPSLGTYMEDVYNVMGRFTRGVYKHEHELRGGAGVRTAADESEFYGKEASSWVEQNDRMYEDDFIKKIGDKFGLFEQVGKGSELLNRTRRFFNVRQIPQKAEILAAAQFIRRRRALQLENDRIMEKMAAKFEEDPTLNPDDFITAIPTDQGIMDLMPGLKALDNDDEINKAFMDLAEQYADRYDKRYEGLQKINQDAGMLKPEQVIDHYFPQLYNVKQARQDMTGFLHFIHQVFEKEPDIDWINEMFHREMVDAGVDANGNKIQKPDGKAIDEGETLADVAARDPKLYTEIRERWADTVRAAELDHLEKNIEAIQAKLDDSQYGSMKEMEAHHAKLDAAHNKAIDKDNAALDAGDEVYLNDPDANEGWSQLRDGIKERLAKRSWKRAEDQKKLDENRAAYDMADRHEFLKKERRRKASNKVESSKLMKQLQKKTDKEVELLARDTLAQAVMKIRNAIASGSQSHMGSLPTNTLTTGNSRYMERQINWRQHAFTPQGKKFLDQNVERADNIYAHTTMRQVALRQTLGKYMEGVTGESFEGSGDEMIQATIGYIASQAEIALAKATSQREIDLINKVRTRSLDTFEAFLKNYNNSHTSDMNDSMGLEIVKGGVAITSLGTLGISQLTDPIAATAALPGGFGAKWWGNALNPTMWSGRKAQSLMAQVEGLSEQEGLVFKIMGANAQGTSRFDNMVNPENIGEVLNNHYGEDNAGKMGLLHIITREAGHLQNWATLAPIMNKGTQGNAGMLQAKAMYKYITDYDSFKQIDKENFARLGLGKRQVDMMKKLMDDPSMVQKLDDGTADGIIIPRIDKWPEGLGSAYERAISKAQNEALIAPAFGDMPSALGAYKPLGLFYQFSSFSYTISSTLLRKMIQDARLHPSQIQNHLLPLVAGIGLGAQVMYLKNRLIYGKSDEEIWDRPMPEIVWDVYSRSPFVAGQVAAFTEAAFQLVGGGINDAVGRNVVPQAANYFKQNQGTMGMFGPLVGKVGTYGSMASQVANGKGEQALERFIKQTAILNTTIARTLMTVTSGEN